MEQELRQASKQGRIVIGFNSVRRLLLKNKLEKIFLARNCPERIKTLIKYLADTAKINLSILEIDNDQLGIKLGKGFSISVLGIKKENG